MDRSEFHCRCCGACCRIKDGIVRVSDAEISRIAAYTDFEYQVGEAVEAVLILADIDDKVTFQRDYIVNTGETIGWVLQSAQYFTPEYTTKKLLTLLGDGDLADDMIEEMHSNELASVTGGTPVPGEGEIDDTGTDTSMTEDVLTQLEAILDEIGE